MTGAMCIALTGAMCIALMRAHIWHDCWCTRSGVTQGQQSDCCVGTRTWCTATLPWSWCTICMLLCMNRMDIMHTQGHTGPPGGTVVWTNLCEQETGKAESLLFATKATRLVAWWDPEKRWQSTAAVAYSSIISTVCGRCLLIAIDSHALQHLVMQWDCVAKSVFSYLPERCLCAQRNAWRNIVQYWLCCILHSCQACGLWRFCVTVLPKTCSR